MTLVLPYQLNLRPSLTATAAGPRKFLGEPLGQAKPRTVGNVDTWEGGKNAFLTDRVPSMELGKRGLHQLLQKGHCPRRGSASKHEENWEVPDERGSAG